MTDDTFADHVACEQCAVLSDAFNLSECGCCTAVICPTCREQTRSGWCHECLMTHAKTEDFADMRERGQFDEQS